MIRWDLILSSNSGVTGAFLQTEAPISLLRPFSKVDRCQLSSRGLMRLMYLSTERYCLTEEYDRRADRCATYRHTVSWVTGNGEQASRLQKLR